MLVDECFVPEADLRRLDELVQRWFSLFDGEAEASFVHNSRILAEDLPRSIRAIILGFVTEDLTPAIVIRNLWKPSSCSDTPARRGTERAISNPAHVLMGTIMSLTGTVYGYASQQFGRIFNDVIPLQEYEHVGSSSSGSTKRFDLHTEDAHHPYPPDYVGLFCVRNNEHAATTLSRLPHGAINAEDVCALSKPSYEFLSNSRRSGLSDNTVVKPVLFGHPEHPYIQLNPAGTRPVPPEGCEAALDRLIDTLRRNEATIILESGDFLLLNNLRALHGRRAYRPLYGASQRWLIRTLARCEVRRCPREQSDWNSSPLI
jgi:hypothetical protein